MNDFLFAAKKTLAKYTTKEDSLRALYIQPDRQIYLAENSQMILKVYEDGKTLEKEYTVAQKALAIGIPVPTLIVLEPGNPKVLIMNYVVGSPLSSENINAASEAGNYLKLFHDIGALPPFSGGQQNWSEFIYWWAATEIENVKETKIFGGDTLILLKKKFDDLTPLLSSRPIVLLHGDLQAEHILVDPIADKVLAFLDFADAQAGDPLLDIAVLSLRDKKLADLILAGYEGIDNNEETQTLLSHYRLLRYLAEIPWLWKRGFLERVEQNRIAIENEVSAYAN